MSSFTRMASLDCSTKRSPTVDGKSSGLVVHLTGLKCTPLDPVMDNVVNEVVIETPYRMLQTFLQDDDIDIRKGDWLTVAGVDYPIKFVAPWQWSRKLTRPNAKFVRLVLEDRTVNG